MLICELADTSEYHLIATSWYGRTKDNVGKFELILETVLELVDGEVLDYEASSTIGKHYFVRTDRDFSIAYQHSDGRFRPEVSVNVIAQNPYQCGIDLPSCSGSRASSNLHAVAALNGAWLEAGTLEVKAKSPSNEIYLVAVTKQKWSHFDGERRASFTLALNRSDTETAIFQ